MSFYFVQGMRDYILKGGYSDDACVGGRTKSHETRGGPQWTIGTIPGGDREIEAHIFDRLSAWRIRDPHEERRDYELFVPSKEVREFIRGETMREMGFILLNKPRDPFKQTTIDWIKIAKSTGRGKISRAAAHTLEENARLRSIVPASARGGWDLNEAIGGQGSVIKQIPMWFASTMIHGTDWLIHRLTYKGSEFHFPVFAEWYERQTGRRAPAGAIRTGIPILKPKLESGRRGKPIRKVRESVPEEQAALWET